MSGDAPVQVHAREAGLRKALAVRHIIGGSGRTDLIALLNEVATAVGSKRHVDEVLDAVVGSAKRVTDTSKAILCLFDEWASPGGEPVVAAVRGRRDEFPESWWSAELERLAPLAIEAGQPIVEMLPSHDAWFLTAPVRIGPDVLGVIAAINSKQARFTEEQIAFFATLATFAATAIESARLAEETQFVLLASERERIAREIHDGVSQSLFGVSIGLEVARRQVGRDPAGAAVRLEEMQEQVAGCLAELRRVVYDLRPLKLQELGLVGAIEYWLSEVTVGRGPSGRLEVEGEALPLPARTEACLYRVAKEAVANVVKHSEAQSFVVRLSYLGDSVRLEVTDDGHGFRPEEALERAEGGDSLGLKSIRDRVEAERGRIDIRSVPGEGTAITVVLEAAEA
ncbi:MAG: sensor histidine kinase [Actinobacteria bacterium]|nr:MAG: sensor histidine kinase [Actinomycetota bacterium]